MKHLNLSFARGTYVLPQSAFLRADLRRLKCEARALELALIEGRASGLQVDRFVELGCAVVQLELRLAAGVGGGSDAAVVAGRASLLELDPRD